MKDATGSDKNVGSIEEDIKLEEELIKEYKLYGDLDGIQDLRPYMKAIENILNRNKELEEELQRQKEINTVINKENLDDKYEEVLEKVMTKFLNNNIKNDFIPKSLVKEKIEELNKEEKQELKGLKGQDRYFVKQMYQYKRSVLQELLEKRG